MIKLIAAVAALTVSCYAAPASPVENITVLKEDGRFGGWPANNGVWVWGDEILVGFSLGYFKVNERGHSIDPSKKSVTRFARSTDGGRTWRIEQPGFPETPDEEDKAAVEPKGGIDFTHPDFAMAVRMISSSRGFSRFYYSYDRGRIWQGPFRLPKFDRKGIAARTDYIVDGKRECTAFITASKENGKEGRVLCIRTTDGGKTWKALGWIGPEPDGFSIMPSSVRLSPMRILTMVRRKEGSDHFIEAYETRDNGKSWTFLNKPVESTGGSVGNPPSMIRLRDGRLCLTYGYRSAPYGIRAKLSHDEGRTWGKEIILRQDGGTWDLGYPRTVQRRDGNVVTIYYFNDHKDKERYIAASIWDPGK